MASISAHQTLSKISPVHLMYGYFCFHQCPYLRVYNFSKLTLNFFWSS